jgi:hypothetical protein
VAKSKITQEALTTFTVVSSDTMIRLEGRGVVKRER